MVYTVYIVNDRKWWRYRADNHRAQTILTESSICLAEYFSMKLALTRVVIDASSIGLPTGAWAVTWLRNMELIVLKKDDFPTFTGPSKRMRASATPTCDKGLYSLSAWSRDDLVLRRVVYWSEHPQHVNTSQWDVKYRGLYWFHGEQYHITNGGFRSKWKG